MSGRGAVPTLLRFLLVLTLAGMLAFPPGAGTGGGGHPTDPTAGDAIGSPVGQGPPRPAGDAVDLHRGSSIIGDGVPGPGTFVENLGQLDDGAVRFYDPGGAVWFTDDGAWFAVSPGAGSDAVALNHGFPGARPVVPAGEEPTGGRINFIIGDDPRGWFVGARSYGEIWYRDVWEGIDLVYRAGPDGLKYDIVVHPGGRPGDIRMAYLGAEGLELNDRGDLVARTAAGALVDGGLYVYQDLPCGRTAVEGRVVLHSGVEYGFETADHDPSYPLVIDPSLEFSTFVGGNTFDGCRGVAFGAQDDAYLVGYTGSSDFPASPGAFDLIENGQSDAFVAKLEDDGSGVQFATYIGGAGNDWGEALAVDGSGNVFMAGRTDSANFPATGGAFDTSGGGTDYDGFVAKFNPSGTILSYCTYLGGSDHEWLRAIDVDPSGNAYVTGTTASADFPANLAGFDQSHNGGLDAVAVKLNPTGSALVYSTYLGGSGDDRGMDIGVDGVGYACVAGSTDTNGFPATQKAFDTTYNGGDSDAFLLKLRPSGSTLEYSTYLGGHGADGASALQVAADGKVYLTGYTGSSDFPTSEGAFAGNLTGGEDGFAVLVEPDGASLSHSTYLGGPGDERPVDLAVTAFGEAVIAGVSLQGSPPGYPVTADALAAAPPGQDDGFITKISGDASALLYSTFWGGWDDDVPAGVAMDSLGDVIVAGTTSSSDMTTTSGVMDGSLTGPEDGFVLKLVFERSVEVASVDLFHGDSPVNLTYAGLTPYNLRVRITDRVSVGDLNSVEVVLDHPHSNVTLGWDAASGEFSQVSPDQGPVTLLSGGRARDDSVSNWTITFPLLFNWTFPHENLTGVRVTAMSSTLTPAQWYEPEYFSVENDAELEGALRVEGSDGRVLWDGAIVKGGEPILWGGLMPRYQGATGLYPPEGEVGVALWCGGELLGTDTPPPGEPFEIEAPAPDGTEAGLIEFRLNLTGVPPGSDASNDTFRLTVDGTGVVFADPFPRNDTWMNDTAVTAGVVISDPGGSGVDAESVMYAFSTDNGTTWSDWEFTTDVEFDGGTALARADVTLLEGVDNLLRWRASDVLGNGPSVSLPQRVLVDARAPEFHGALPPESWVSPTGDVQVGITVTDNASGVNASSVEYSVSEDAGFTWGTWTPVPGLVGLEAVDVRMELEFPGGSLNRIRFRAWDMAGNGPSVSPAHAVMVNATDGGDDPQSAGLDVTLLSPLDGARVAHPSANLRWNASSSTAGNVTVRVYLGTTPYLGPADLVMEGENRTSHVAQNLISGITYFWYVSVTAPSGNGTASSDMWTFTYDRTIQIPRIRMLTPLDGSEVTKDHLDLVWEAIGNGSGWTYDVYFGEGEDPPIAAKGVEGTLYSVFGLETGKRYHWTVVPITSERVYGAFGETVWKFSVVIKKVTLDLGVRVSPVNEMTVATGGTATVSVMVINVGKDPDTIIVSLDLKPPGPGYSNITQRVFLESGNSSSLVFPVEIRTDAEPGDYTARVVALSERAQMQGLPIFDTAAFIMHVTQGDAPQDHEPGDGDVRKDGEAPEGKGYEVPWFWIAIALLIAGVAGAAAAAWRRKRRAVRMVEEREKRHERRKKVRRKLDKEEREAIARGELDEEWLTEQHAGGSYVAMAPKQKVPKGYGAASAGAVAPLSLEGGYGVPKPGGEKGGRGEEEGGSKEEPKVVAKAEAPKAGGPAPKAAAQVRRAWQKDQHAGGAYVAMAPRPKVPAGYRKASAAGSPPLPAKLDYGTQGAELKPRPGPAKVAGPDVKGGKE